MFFCSRPICFKLSNKYLPDLFLHLSVLYFIQAFWKWLLEKVLYKKVIVGINTTYYLCTSLMSCFHLNLYHMHSSLHIIPHSTRHSTFSSAVASSSSSSSSSSSLHILWWKCGSYQKVVVSFVGLSVTDMYMLHWPDSMQPGRSNRELRAESWRALEELEKLGKEPYTKLNNLNYVLIWAC